MKRQPSILLAASLLVLCMPSSASAEVFVVAKNGIADFDELQDAVVYAAEGDTIWVRGGDYQPVVIDGKGLHIVAVEEGRVVVERLAISNLLRSQALTLTGVDVRRTVNQDTTVAVLSIADCEGSVRLQDCSVKAGHSLLQSGTALSIADCDDVSLVRCSLNAFTGDAFLSWGVPLVGCWVQRSRVAIFDSELEGRGAYDSGHAYTGLLAIDSAVLLHRTLVTGGRGLSGYFCTPGTGAAGITGQGMTEFYLLESRAVGGHGGWGETFGCEGVEGPHGPPFDLGPKTTIEFLQIPGRSWTCDNLVFGGDSIAIHFEGLPGDRLHIVRSTVGEFEWALSNGGVRLIAQPSVASPLIGAAVSGDLDVLLPIEDLRPHVPEETFILQAYVIDAQGELVWLSSGSLSVLRSIRGEPYTSPVHVDSRALPGGDGSSWKMAFNDLEQALSATYQSWEEDLPIPRDVWIAEGTYIVPADPEVNFEFHFTGSVLGGFAGSETNLSQRPVVGPPTILSGDLLGDDAPGFLNRGDNADIIAFAEQQLGGELLLDRLTFSGADSVSSWGGGLSIKTHGAQVRLRDCSFRDNRSIQGGGVAATLGTGPHALGYPASKVYFERCIFENNRAELGGGVRVGPLSPQNPIYPIQQVIFEACRFENNEALDQQGGGLWAFGVEILLLNCQFLSNRALLSSAGGAYVAPVIGISGTIVGCEFRGNQAERGGALHLWGHSGSTFLVVNSSLYDNHASVEGGGLLVNNNLPLGQEGLSVLSNSILWGNSAAGVISEDAQIALVGGLFQPQYNCVEGWSGIHGGPGNHGFDPLLTPDGQLGPGSPCIDSGRNSIVPSDSLDLDDDGDVDEPLPLDLAGNPRFVDDPTVPDTGVGHPPLVDRGAYEYQQ